MNKKIVELSQQALDYAAMELAVSGHGGISRFNQLYRDKFAELIVAECIELAGNHYDACGAVNDIKQHFGVEL